MKQVNLLLDYDDCDILRAGLYQLQHEATKRNNALTNVDAGRLADLIAVAQSRAITERVK